MAHDDTTDKFKEAVKAAAELIHQGMDSYDAAANLSVPKTVYTDYARSVAAAIVADQRLHHCYNQGGQRLTTNLAAIQVWLGRHETGWVHCFSAAPPSPSTHRVYVCAKLDRTAELIRHILAGYTKPQFYFKVADAAEAANRNDTIVSWHASWDDALSWANLAAAHPDMLSGNAPAGTTIHKLTSSVSIDKQIANTTSTMKIAEAAQKLAAFQAMRNNPYTDP